MRRAGAQAWAAPWPEVQSCGTAGQFLSRRDLKTASSTQLGTWPKLQNNNREKTMHRKTRVWKVASGVAILVVATFAAASAQPTETKSVSVRHPNLLLNQEEIEQIKLKVKEHSWAARLLDCVKAKAEKDGAALEAALAYALTGEAKYAVIVRNRLAYDARWQLAKYEKLDVKAEPEWGRWTQWGATAWAYDLAYDAFTADERGRSSDGSAPPLGR